MRLTRLLDTIGTALVLQLLFVVCALPVVTVVPAAIALQRQWAGFLRGEKTTMAAFFLAFGRAFRVSWLPGILLPLIVAALAVSFVFWSNLTGWIGAIGLGLLLGFGLVGVAYWLALLATSERAPELPWTGWFRPAFAELVRRSTRYAAALAVMVLWGVALWLVLPLALAGSGIVPAAAAHAASHPRVRRALEQD